MSQQKTTTESKPRTQIKDLKVRVKQAEQVRGGRKGQAYLPIVPPWKKK
jgi:hypothetical protein